MASKAVCAKAKEMMSLMKNNDTFIVLDRESTSFQPNMAYGKLLELSAVKVVKGEIVDSYDTLINPEMKIPAKITELTGIDNTMTKNAPKWQVVVDEFLSFCEDYPIVAHNASTDIKYIDFYSQKIGRKFEPETIDTLTLAKYIHRNDDTFKSFNLKSLAEAHSIQGNGYHRAMNDVIITSELFEKFKKLLKKEMNAVKPKVSQQKLSLPETNVSNTSFGVTNYNLWKKEINGKQFLRLYITIKHEPSNHYTKLYYDYLTKNWGIKELGETLPSDYKERIIKEVSRKKNISESKFFESKMFT